MSRKYRLISFFFAVVFLAFFVTGFLPSSAEAATVTGYDYEHGVKWERSFERVTITGQAGMTKTDIVIPEEIQGYPVYAIGEGAFRDCTEMQSISLPSTLKVIGDYAFQGCISLASVDIPESVANYGFYAFEGCKSLRSGTIGSFSWSVSEEGTFCLSGSGVTPSLSLGGAPWEEAQFDIDSLKIDPEITSIGNYLFSGFAYVRDVAIPSGVTTIGDGAFYSCGFTSVEVPAGVATIGERAFYFCDDLARITIPESVTHIGKGAFCFNKYTGDKSKVLVSTPEQYSLLCNNSDYIDLDLASVFILEKGLLYEVENGGAVLVGYMEAAEEILVPAEIKGCPVVAIGDGSFKGCSTVKSIVLPESVKTIGEEAFEGSALENVDMPGVSSIGYAAFYQCDSLASATIPNGVTSIPDYCFFSCDSLADITIPESVVSFGRQPFSYIANPSTVHVSTMDQYTLLKGSSKYIEPSTTTVLLIGGMSIDPPFVNELVYDGTKQVGVVAGEGYELSGIYSAIDAGKYIATATPLGDNAWSDGRNGPISVEWSIDPVSISEASSSEIEDQLYAYRYEEFKPNIDITFNETLLEQDVDYMLAYHDNTDVGSAYVVVTGIGNFAGTKVIDFQINDPADYADFVFTVGDSAQTCPLNCFCTPTSNIKVNSSNPSVGSAGNVRNVLFDDEDTYTLSTAVDFTPTAAGYTELEVYWNNGHHIATLLIAVKPNPAIRIWGDYANETSAKISESTFDKSEWVVIARDDDFADAMSATGLAGALECPIILTDRYGLSDAAAAEIKRLGATRAYIIGGPGAMPGPFEKELRGIGFSTVERVYGDYAWDTSVACAEKIIQHGGNDRDSIVSMSLNFQDALSISSFAYKYKVPIYLQTQSGNRPLPQAAINRIARTSGKIYVPGGPGAVKTSTVESAFGASRVVRIYGEDGYDTSNQIAFYMVENGLLSSETVVVACGAQAAKGTDALAGAALAGKNGGVMLLANSNTDMESTHLETIEGFDSQGSRAFLSSHKGLMQAYVLGGTYVVPENLFNKIKEIVASK